MRARKIAPFALAAISLAGCGSSGSSVGAASPAAPGASDEASASTASADAGAAKGGGYGAPANAPAATAGTLKIAGFQYDPNPLTVAPGQVVPVTNTDSAEHTATSDVTGLFIADDVKSGKTISFKAPTRPGRYTFHCQYHASMHGTLIVK